MTTKNIFGPFGAGINETVSRPTDQDSESATDTWFQDCVNGIAGTGTKIPANWLNKISAVLRRATRGMGVPDEPTDDDLLLKAIQKAARGVESLGATGAGIIDIQNGINPTTNAIKIRKIRGVGITFSIDNDTGEVVATLGGGTVTLASIAPTLMLQEQRAGNAAAYALPQNVWTRRQLNTQIVNQIGAGVSDYQVTLSAGTYRWRAGANANNAQNAQIRLRDVTHNVTLGLGLDIDSNASNEPTVTSFCEGWFSLSSSSSIELQQIRRDPGVVLAGDDTPIGSDTHVDAFLTIIKET